MGQVASKLTDRAPSRVLAWTGSWALAFLSMHQALLRRRQLNLSHTAGPAASRLAGILHSGVASCVVGHSIFSSSLAQVRRDVDATNTEPQNRLLEFTLGYFIVDFFWLLTFDRDTALLLHHIAVLILFASCRALGRSATGPLLGFALAEVTGPLQNAWWLLKRAGNLKWADRLALPYTVLFVLCRVFLMSYYVLPIAYDAVTGEGCRSMQPVWARVWAVLCISATVGGWVWSKNLLLGFVRRFMLPPAVVLPQ